MNLSTLKKIKSLLFKTGQPSKTGFSLIELLVALAVFSIVVALIVSARIGQQDQELTQQQAVEMQQTVRSALLLMSKDIRMAGYDPDNDFSVGIIAAGDGSAGTTLDLSYVEGFDNVDNDSDGQTDEADELSSRNVSYQLLDKGPDGTDTNPDGDMDLTLDTNGGGYHLLAENIDSLEFVYLDEDGNPIATPAAELDNIRALRITITAGVDNQELDRFPENNTRSLTTTVKCRNLGL